MILNQLLQSPFEMLQATQRHLGDSDASLGCTFFGDNVPKCQCCARSVHTAGRCGGDRIEKVADGSAAIPEGANMIDLSNATVLPGLIDSHTHIFLWGEEPAKGGYDANILKAGIALRAARATYAAKRALEQGFT